MITINGGNVAIRHQLTPRKYNMTMEKTPNARLIVRFTDSGTPMEMMVVGKKAYGNGKVLKTHKAIHMLEKSEEASTIVLRNMEVHIQKLTFCSK